MKFRFSAAALLAAILLSPTASANPAATKTDLPWQYITDADDGTLYFGRKIRHYDGLTFMEMKTEADPDGTNGDESRWMQPVDCAAKTLQDSERQWVPIKRNSVGEQWLQHACESRTNLSDRKGVDA